MEPFDPVLLFQEASRIGKGSCVRPSEQRVGLHRVLERGSHVLNAGNDRHILLLPLPKWWGQTVAGSFPFPETDRRLNFWRQGIDTGAYAPCSDKCLVRGRGDIRHGNLKGPGRIRTSIQRTTA